MAVKDCQATCHPPETYLINYTAGALCGSVVDCKDMVCEKSSLFGEWTWYICNRLPVRKCFCAFVITILLPIAFVFMHMMDLIFVRFAGACICRTVFHFKVAAPPTARIFSLL